MVDGTLQVEYMYLSPSPPKPIQNNSKEIFFFQLKTKKHKDKEKEVKTVVKAYQQNFGKWSDNRYELADTADQRKV